VLLAVTDDTRLTDDRLADRLLRHAPIRDREMEDAGGHERTASAYQL
jgi:hypothetical protein